MSAHLAQGLEPCSKSALACSNQSLFPNYQHLHRCSRMCHVEANQEHCGKLCSFGRAARGNSLARPWSLNLILLCDRACKLTLQPESPASSWRACCRPCKSVVVGAHGAHSRAEGDTAELWMGLKEGLRCPRTLLLSRMVEKNAGSSSRAGDLQSNCSLGQGLFLSSKGSHTQLCTLWLNKVLIIAQPLPPWIAPSRLRKYFYSYFFTCPSKVLVRWSAEAHILLPPQRR